MDPLPINNAPVPEAPVEAVSSWPGWGIGLIFFLFFAMIVVTAIINNLKTLRAYNKREETRLQTLTSISTSLESVAASLRTLTERRGRKDGDGHA